MSSSASSMDEPILPYNSNYRILTPQDVTSFLQAYGVQESLRNIAIYRNSMVHKSYCTRKNENFVDGNTNCPLDCLPLQEESNERLEFLGDAVLGMTVASYLFERFPDENEGFLTRMRTKLVNGKMLAHLSKLVGLPPFVILSKQIDENNGRDNLNILEDAFEAFIAAIYTDINYDAASTWIIGVIETHVDFADLINQNNNFKDQFLKAYQQMHGYVPKFFEMNVNTQRNGQKLYTVCIKDAKDAVLAIGRGANKKEAENDAAKTAHAKLTLF